MKYVFQLLGLSAFLLLSSSAFSQQIYTVNSTNDLDDGACNAAHCSLREAIKAADADGTPSNIVFAIPGAGPHVINPLGTLPDVNTNSTRVLGESQSGSPGDIIINLNFRVLGGVPFWRILGDSFFVSGIGFNRMNFDQAGDHILEFGDATNASDFSTVYRCAFWEDAALAANTITHAVKLTRGMDIIVRRCVFGADFSGSIRGTRGMVALGNGLGLGNATIDSCNFVTSVNCIEARSGQCTIRQNIFGALDTSKALNFLDPSYGISLFGGGIYRVSDNFFFGQKIAGIQTNDLSRPCDIRTNRFYNGNIDIEINGVSASDYNIITNYGRDGKDFLNVNTMGAYSLFFERNSLSRYTNAYVNNIDPGISQARHVSNYMTCMSNKPITLNGNPKSNPPSVSTVNRNQVTGTGNANDSICVYANPSLLCPGNSCQGGFELGRTQCDASGNWTLNVNYPNRHHISAYQYPGNNASRPNVYSEFSNCYVCQTPVRTVFSPSICPGGSVRYRNRTYNSSNLKDSFGIVGDGVSICDSIFIVDVRLNPGSRNERFVNVCYRDTVFVGPLKIFDGKLADSVILQDVNMCDSLIVVYGTVRGLSSYTGTICNTDQLRIGNDVFDRNRTSGVAIIPGGSAFGCDSVVTVNLTVKNFAERNLDTAICKGQSIVLNGEVFDENRTTGDQTLIGGSANGCDSVIHVKLFVADPTYTYRLNICPNDSVLIGGANGQYFGVRNPKGQFILPNGSYLKCDSIINVDLNVRPEGMGQYTANICRRDTITLQGQKFSSGRTSGTLRVANGSANGCDSLINVQLTVIPDANGNLDTIACQGGSVDIYGTIFDAARPSGALRLPITSYRGCDTFLTVNLSFVSPKFSDLTPTICSKDQFTVGSEVFNINRPSGNVVISRPASQGCDSTIRVSLSFSPPIVPSFSVEDIRCQIPNTGVVQIDGIGSGPGPFSVSVDGRVPAPFTPGMRISNLSQGNHQIRIIDALGCDSVFSFAVRPSAALALTMPADTTILLGGNVTLRPNASFIPSTIVWSPSTGLSCSDCLNPIAAPTQTTSYTLTLTDANGCEITGSVTISVKVPESDVYIPNVFSPNGDGVNEFFEVTFRFPDRSKILVMRVFDRWGNMVFQREGTGIGDQVKWDGRYMGKELQPGVYTYAIRFESEGSDPQWRHGDITIMR